MSKLSQFKKDFIVGQARSLMHARWPGVSSRPGCCVFASLALGVALRSNGINAIPQAGTCYWPRITQEQDDGVSPNVFGYCWEPDSINTILKIARDELPEIHAWVALPQTNEIIDITTRHLKEQCETLATLKWTAPDPPDYLWEHCLKLPDYVLYKPDTRAIKYLISLYNRGL